MKTTEVDQHTEKVEPHLQTSDSIHIPNPKEKLKHQTHPNIEIPVPQAQEEKIPLQQTKTIHILIPIRSPMDIKLILTQQQ